MSTPWVHRFSRWLMAGGLSLLSTIGGAEEASTAWLARSWQTEDGLPDNSVVGLAQSADGFLWIGSPSGLARFDGKTFENFSLKGVAAPPNRGVISLLPCRQGGVWMAMDRGEVVCLKGRSTEIYRRGLPEDPPLRFGLAETQDGALWVSYPGGTVCRLQNGVVMMFTSRQGLPEGYDDCALAADKSGQLWFAKSGQVGAFREGAFQPVHSFESQTIRLAAARDGGIWISDGSRLYKSDRKGELSSMGALQLAESGSVVDALLEDRDGAVWLGTSFSGLYRWTQSGFERVPTSARRISSLLEAKEGNIWVGTVGGGLDCIVPRAITLEGIESGLPVPTLLSICEDTDGTLWAVGQNGELVHQARGHWTAIPKAPDWPGEATCVTSDRRGSIWIGTRHGLFCWRDGHLLDRIDLAATREKSYSSIVASQSGDVWLGQQVPKALVRFRDGHCREFALPSDSRSIRALTEDPAGNIWAGTAKGTLFRVTGEKLTEMTPRAADELAPIRCVQATSDGSVWLGYAGWGVGRIQKGQYAEFNLEQGLYDNSISQILSDKQGWLWFGANRGLFKVRQQDFLDVLAGKAARVRSIHYGRGDGLPSLQAAFGSSPNALHGQNGQLRFLMQTALAVVNPARLNDQRNPPPPLLSRVTVDDRLVGQYRGVLPVHPDAEAAVMDLSATRTQLRLPPGHRRIEIEFNALNYQAPENTRFRYRLKGFEDAWVDCASRRSAAYSRLPAGQYVFEMTAANSEGDWNPDPASLRLEIAPFYWQTWWFRLAGVTLLLGIVIATVRLWERRKYRARLKKLEQESVLQKERARIAKDIHDELGSSLTQISLLGKFTQCDLAEPEKARAHVEKMSNLARQGVRSVDEIVWAVNPRNDTLGQLLDYAGQYAVDFLRAANIRCRIDFPATVPHRELPADVRHGLFMVVKEALNNAAKHSGASELVFRVTWAEAVLALNLTDNGAGFAARKEDALADGFRNMSQRATDLGGRCTIESQPGKGTTVKVELKLP